MRTQLKVFIGLFLTFFILDSYAIQVNVQSPSKDVFALGFTVNGKNHGGAGSSYRKSDMPVGMYTFGVRVGGLFGTDVGCSTNTGQKTVTLNHNATAVLNYDGKRCILKIYGSR